MDSLDNLLLLATVAEEEDKKKQRKKSKVTLRWHEMQEEQESFIEDHIMENVDLHEQNDDNGKETHEAPANLAVSLFNYQQEWLAWALKQEESEVKGGILADEMGMGKTLQTIALVLAKREIFEQTGLDSESSSSSSSSDLPKIKSTLVICPSVAVTQWEKEIEKSTIKGSVKVFVHDRSKKAKSIEEFSDYDFVITTYHTVIADCKKCNMKFTNNARWKRKQNKEGEVRAILHSVKWERIVLDEAHTIKNASTYTAGSIHDLESSYRWALTGTPMLNHADELYSLMNFLRVFPYSYLFCNICNCEILGPSRCIINCDICGHGINWHFSWWRKYVSVPLRGNKSERGRRAMILLQHKVLKDVMLRRTKKGRAFEVYLPSKTVVMRWDILDTNEKDNYNSLQSDAVAKVNQYIEQGNLMNNLPHVFSILIRLRQAVDHPYIGTYSGINAEKSGGAVDNYADARECRLCHDLAEDAFVAPCSHVFCKPCLMEEGTSSTIKIVDCPSCLQPINVDAIHTSNKKKSKKPATILDRIDLNKFQTSTKLEALREEIMFMIEGDGTAKGVVFSHFIPFLDLAQYTLKMSGVKSVLLVGSTGQGERDKILKQFTEDPDCRILLLCLKLGAVALNLTVASHVFLMDPWWNSAMEDQAQDRVHRIGQKKPVRVTRFLIKDTIEERIFRLQLKKKAAFEGAIGGTARLEETDYRALLSD